MICSKSTQRPACEQSAGCLVRIPTLSLITRSLRELTALSVPQFIICGGIWVLLGMGLVWHWVGTIQTFFSQALASADLTLNNVLPGTSCGISLWKRE